MHRPVTAVYGRSHHWLPAQKTYMSKLQRSRSIYDLISALLAQALTQDSHDTP